LLLCFTYCKPTAPSIHQKSIHYPSAYFRKHEYHLTKKHQKYTHSILKSHKNQLTNHHETVTKQLEATPSTLRDIGAPYKLKIIHGDVGVKGRSQNSEARIQLEELEEWSR
jgi:hypothetical protein